MPFENYSSSANAPAGDGYTRIPTLRIGQPLDTNDATEYPSSMNLVGQVQQARQSVARIEAVKGQDVDGTPTGSVGSGFVVTADGSIATDYHVVQGANSIRVKIGDNTYSANIDAVDQAHDLALLRVNASPNERFRPVELAPSSQMERGAATIALGFPAGEQKLYMSAGGFNWAPGGFQAYRRFGDIVGNLKGGLMPGEDPNRISIESNMNADQGISGGPMYNDRFQVVGVMDIGTTTGSKGDATPVEDLQRLLSSSQRMRMASNTGAQYGLNLQNESPAPNYYSTQPQAAPSYYASFNSPANARAEYTVPATSSSTSWADLAKILDRGSPY